MKIELNSKDVRGILADWFVEHHGVDDDTIAFYSDGEEVKGITCDITSIEN